MANQERAKQIYEQACAMPPSEREALIARETAGDADRAALVRSLLREADTYDLPPSDAVATSDTPAAAPPERDHGNTAVSFDHYRLLSVIGEGGFGEVWEAEQHEPVRRRVAIKVIKAGMDSASVVARFEAERQALAVMNHPCIARVFDAGTTPPELGARPYFVMELVRGDPISAFCDLNKLSLADRVQLMVKVCEAVQHAHAKGVIHRDLKPGNILVQYQDGVPTPKVIDFGVAKAIDQRLTEKTIFTERGQLIGTPEYMSPEQAEMSGTDIDTRSDIYSLGVVLYELLTGTLPFDSTSLRSAGYAEIQRIIREIEPPKPSTRLSGDRSAAPLRRGPDDRQSATRTLRRDLDWVVMKCLEKPRERRYDTARGLADDLQRFLRHEPVSAGPPSVGYQAQKFVRRHRTAVGISALTVTLLVLGLATTAWQWRVAETNRGLAERRLDRIRGFTGDFLQALDRDLKRLPGTTVARQATAEAAVSLLDGLASDEAEAEPLAADLGRSYRRAAQIGSDGVRPTEETVGVLEQAVQWSERALANEPDRDELRVDVALAYSSLSRRRVRLNELDRAAEAVERAEQLIAGIADRALARADVALARATLEAARGDMSSARPHFSRAVDLSASALRDSHAEADNQLFLAQLLIAWGASESETEHWQPAIDAYERATRTLEPVLEQSPERADAMLLLQRAQRGKGYVLISSGRGREGIAAYEASDRMAQQIFESDPASRRAAEAWRDLYDDWADVYFGQGYYKRAAATYDTFRDRAGRLVEDDPLNARYRHTAALAAEKAGDAYFTKAQWDRRDGDQKSFDRAAATAAERFDEAFGAYISLSTREPDNAEWHTSLARCGHRYGDLLSQLGRYPEARRAYERATESFDRLASLDALVGNAAFRQSLALRALGYACLALEDAAGAETALRNAIDTAPDDDPMLGKVLGALAEARALRGDFDEARKLAAQGFEFFEQIPQADRQPRQQRALDGMRELLEHLERGEIPPDEGASF